MLLDGVARVKTTLAYAYERYPVSVLLSVSAVLLLLVWHAPFIGGAIIPYDYQTAHYPWYVDAVRAAKYSVFCLYNPFNDAGQPTWNVFAFNDPPQWLPVLLPQLPGYTALQSFELAHLILIPVGLLLVAWANDVPRRRWIFIVAIAVAGYAMGPTLKYMQQSTGIVASSYTVLLFGALEAFRRSGKVGFALLAGACAAYIFEAFVYAAIFLPVLIAAYALANWRELFMTRARTLALGGALLVALIIAAPALAISQKVDHQIELARDLQQLAELHVSDLGAMLGAPSSVLPLIAIPAALLALVASAFGSLSVGQRWAYGVGIGLLVLYGFGDSTPFGPILRHIYPVAGLVRRPYTTWYVLLPFLLVLATIGLRAISVNLVRLFTGLSFVAAGASLALGAIWFAALAIMVTQALTFWRPRAAVIVAILVVQWLAIDWLPFSVSVWQPKPIPVAEKYLNPYRDIEQYIGTEQASSLSAFRIANIGVPATFGPSAGMYRYYDVAADYNTFIPHELVRELQTDQLHGMVLGGYFDANPEAFASPPWERLAVRYYIVGSDAFALLPRAAWVRKGLHLIPSSSYWKVVEDDSAAPFVAGLRGTARPIAIAAAMTRDSFAFTVPTGVDAVRFAQNFDPWWHARDDQGFDRSNLLRDDDGQLTLTAQPLAGRRIIVEYSDSATRYALGLSIAAQLGLILTYLAFGIVRRSRRPSTPTTV